MRLLSVKVEDFKCVEDSEKFSIDQVTCLVGKNESGKSALLQALYKLNPDREEQRDFNLVEEYPRRYLTEYQKRRRMNSDEPEANVLTTEWELEPSDIEAVERILGAGVINNPSGHKRVVVTVSKGYNNVMYWGVDLIEREIVRHFLSPAQLSQQEQEVLEDAKTVKELIERLETVGSPSERQSTLLTKLKEVFPDKSAGKAAIGILNKQLPRFVYFASYHRLPGAVSVEKLRENIQNKNAKPLPFEDQIFLSLLSLAGTTQQDIAGAGKFEQYIANIEAVSNSLTRQIFEYWSQNRYLKVKFLYEPARPQDPPPFNAGNIFRTRIENTRHEASVSFDERSAGFVWFFSFLVWFSQLQEIYGEKLILLLDEPGLSLHGKAQQDLVRYINEKLRPCYQVIYTSHSPWMIDGEHPLGIRTVEDVVEKAILNDRGETIQPERLLGTKVGDRVLSRDPDTVFPLQGYIGWGLTQFLFVGRHNLLVEGPGELLYLKWFSGELRLRDRESLDIRWVVVPCEGVDKISPFVSLFSGNDLHMAVIVDYHVEVKNRVHSLEDSRLLEKGHVFRVDQYVGQAEADIEDLLGRDFYISLVNECYGLTKAQQLPKSKPKGTSIRVVKEVEAHFRTLPNTIANFDHYNPASYLMEHGATLKATVSGLDDALDRFEKLFRDLNKLLPS